MSATSGATAAGVLLSFVERIERLQAEKESIAADIREVLAEARQHGFDKQALRQIIGLRKMDPAAAAEHQTLVDLYQTTLDGPGAAA